ncbi:hypothetical protein [Agromyces seonyuensis]|uniref:Lipoprotein n=1 Tax=Agromyces seonyuensis TaxID=2662446 RepID=A0A6I4NZS5_9MICO|nr:hypothetical protein [Agromyces seonyuensis]MWB98742.1 hypothetical protein [Agromyces seonyuensis]
MIKSRTGRVALTALLVLPALALAGCSTAAAADEPKATAAPSAEDTFACGELNALTAMLHNASADHDDADYQTAVAQAASQAFTSLTEVGAETKAAFKKAQTDLSGRTDVSINDVITITEPVRLACEDAGVIEGGYRVNGG